MIGSALSVHDVLVILGAVVGVYVALVAVAHLAHRSWAVRFGLTFHLMAVMAGALAGITLSSWRSPLAASLQRQLSAAAVILAAFPIVAILNRVLWKRRRIDGHSVEAPRVLADATGILVVFVAALLVLQDIYGIHVPGLLAGSGVVAIIGGLALQGLLGNLFAGIALHFEQPFTTGDWLLVDGVHAQVIGVSWRSTRLLTTDDVLIDVANSRIMTETITNFAKPSPRHALRVTIGLHYDVPPARAQEVLREACASVAHVCVDPPPVVFVKELGESSITYEIKAWVDDHAFYQDVWSDLRSHCWYAVRRAGMEIPYQIVTINRPKPARTIDTAREMAGRALRAHPIFGFLSDEQVNGLLERSPLVLFAPTEHIIEQGAAGDSMFLIVRGGVDVRIARDGRSASATPVGAGDCFGEMSLLTGEPRSATVVAVEEVEAIEIGRTVFADLIRDEPDVVNRLTDLLVARQLANEQQSAAGALTAGADETRAGLLRQLRRFFQLGM